MLSLDRGLVAICVTSNVTSLKLCINSQERNSNFLSAQSLNELNFEIYARVIGGFTPSVIKFVALF